MASHPPVTQAMLLYGSAMRVHRDAERPMQASREPRQPLRGDERGSRVAEQVLPVELVEGRHTPLFWGADLPEPLAVVHRTTVWATLHVQQGSVRYVELTGPDAPDMRLETGDHAVIAPGTDHQIEPSTDARFFVQFYRDPDDEPIGQARPLPAGTNRHGGPWTHRGTDLDSAEEILELVTRQYADIVQDDLLAPYFTGGPRHLDWQAHIRSVADYWQHVVLLTPDYDIDVLEGHRHLHDQNTFTPEIFDRWLQIFIDAVDGGWTGPNAELAKKRATGMARAMALRYLGKGAWTPAGVDR